jgi:hypothetical protein
MVVNHRHGLYVRAFKFDHLMIAAVIMNAMNIHLTIRVILVITPSTSDVIDYGGQSSLTARKAMGIFSCHGVPH